MPSAPSTARPSFPKVLKDRGIEILDTITFQTGDIDYSAQVTRAKALMPDGIVISALYNEAGNLVRELGKQDLKKPMVVGVGVNNPRFIELAGTMAEGIYAASDFFDSNKRPGMGEWVKEFRKRLDVQPTNAAGEMYDTLYLMRQCIVAMKAPAGSLQSQRDAIANALVAQEDARVGGVGVELLVERARHVHLQQEVHAAAQSRDRDTWAVRAATSSSAGDAACRFSATTYCGSFGSAVERLSATDPSRAIAYRYLSRRTRIFAFERRIIERHADPA